MVLAFAGVGYADTLPVSMTVTVPADQWGVSVLTATSGYEATALGPYDYSIALTGSPPFSAPLTTLFPSGTTSVSANGYCIQVDNTIYVGQSYPDFSLQSLNGSVSLDGDPFSATTAKQISALWNAFGSPSVNPPQTPTPQSFALGLAIWMLVDPNYIKESSTTGVVSGVMFDTSSTNGTPNYIWGTPISGTALPEGGTFSSGLEGNYVQLAAEQMYDMVQNVSSLPSSISPDLYAIVGTGDDSATQGQSILIALGTNGGGVTTPEPGACAALIGLSLSFWGLFCVRRRVLCVRRAV
jgi:hypothetical protein